MLAGELLYEMYDRMHADIVNGVAGNGSNTTTLVDTTYDKLYPTNKFKGWILTVKKTDNEAAPQGEWTIITASVANPFSITFAAITAVAAGDEYALCKPIIPLYKMLDLMKKGLRQLDKIERWDRSLTTADQTLRYTLPIAMKGSPLRSIRLEDSQYNQFKAPNFHVEPNGAGVAPTLVFKSQPTSGLTIAIQYLVIHDGISVYSDPIDELIHPDLAAASCFERAMWWKCQPKRRKIDMENWAQAKALLQQAKMDHPIPMPVVEENRVPLTMFN